VSCGFVPHGLRARDSGSGGDSPHGVLFAVAVWTDMRSSPKRGMPSENGLEQLSALIPPA